MGKIYKMYDLCAGVGGIRLGFESTGRFKTVLSCEYDNNACETYKKNFGDDPRGDVVEMSERASELPDVDVIVAGFPCQTFSMIGKRKDIGDDERGQIFFKIAKIIDKKRPRAVFFENVSGLKSHDNKRTFSEITRVMTEDLGYLFFHAKLDSKDFGLAQKRARIYMVGLREDYWFQFPTPDTSKRARLRDVLEKDVDPSFYLSQVYLSGLKRHKEEQRRKGRGFGYEILDKDGLSNTLVTGGSGRERNLVREESPPEHGMEGKNTEGVRMLTPREFARLQGFPDSYVLPEVNGHAYKQMGNSVSVPVIRKIAVKIADALDEQGER